MRAKDHASIFLAPIVYVARQVVDDGYLVKVSDGGVEQCVGKFNCEITFISSDTLVAILNHHRVRVRVRRHDVDEWDGVGFAREAYEIASRFW